MLPTYNSWFAKDLNTSGCIRFDFLVKIGDLKLKLGLSFGFLVDLFDLGFDCSIILLCVQLVFMLVRLL